ncbi:LysR family transcriptional regulator [Solimonas marina]|uniref:LysR family transcriptional regulator n=1 Tax=Solimonas marina TaxID=2714601 RepID=A0A969W978_9GAMM|nr:LysR family transcriptional regulator [Solimonas marina]NKF22318.1 LysR family transcriptional regulator [Solimonas marina]
MPDQSHEIPDGGDNALPPVRAIQAFEAIVRRGSVAAAADELGVSSGAVSQQLRKIERELNVRLMKRDGRSLTLTSWGRVYYEQVRAAFDQLRRAQHRLQVARTKQGVVISTPPSLASWLQRTLLEWSLENPTVSLRVIGADSEPSLLDEGIDFRLCYGTNARRHDRFSELFRDTIVPACAPKLLRGLTVRNEVDILAGPLIEIDGDKWHRAPPSWSDWAWSCGLPPPRQESRLVVSPAGTAIDAAIGGAGFVLGPVSIIADHVRQGRLTVPIDRRIDLNEPYFLAWERNALDRRPCADLRHALIAAGRAQQRTCIDSTTPLTADTDA